MLSKKKKVHAKTKEQEAAQRRAKRRKLAVLVGLSRVTRRGIGRRAA